MIAIGCFFAVSYASTTPAQSSSTVNVVDASLVTINNKTGDRVHQGIPFTGEARSHHPDGTLAKAEQFKQGRRHGYVKHWFSNGTLGYEAYYQIGRRHGTSTSWWVNGNMRSQTSYSNDDAEGEAWAWYSNGNKYKKYNYVAGQPSGLQQGWRLNGKLFSNFEYRNGRAYGLRNSNLCVELNDEKIATSKLTNN